MGELEVVGLSGNLVVMVVGLSSCKKQKNQSINQSNFENNGNFENNENKKL